MKNLLVVVFYFVSILSFGQVSGPEVGVELNSGVSTKTTLPFWATANKKGTIPNSAYGSLNASIGQFFSQPEKHWDFSYRGSFSGYLAKENLAFVNELYGSVRFRGLLLTIGNRYDKVKWEGLSSSNGNFVKSLNARAMPGINLETNGFVPLFFWKDWFSVKANYAEYLMNDDRIVEGAHAHHKSLHLKFKTSEKFSFSIGLDDWTQWGGYSPTYGQQPEDFESYIKMVFGMSGGENSNEEDQINTLGNHIGNYLVELNHLGEQFNWNFYWSHPFEDRSGRELMNWPDALYGLAVDLKNEKAFVNYIVAEVTYTRNVSGSQPHYESGQDNYFINYTYKSGWSYFGKTIGTPYIISEIDEDGISTGPDLNYNRFVAFNISSRGYIKEVKYRALLSYIKYSPWFGRTYDSEKHQFSGFAEFNLSPLLNWPLDVEIGTSFDLGTRLPNNFGGFLKISKNINFK